LTQLSRSSRYRTARPCLASRLPRDTPVSRLSSHGRIAEQSRAPTPLCVYPLNHSLNLPLVLNHAPFCFVQTRYTLVQPSRLPPFSARRRPGYLSARCHRPAAVPERGHQIHGSRSREMAVRAARCGRWDAVAVPRLPPVRGERVRQEWARKSHGKDMDASVCVVFVY
jgi:hypothetical protein